MICHREEVLRKFYFIGEYGYAFRQLLPFLEKNNMELELVTWPSICKIIDLLWVGRYKTIDVNKLLNCELSEKFRDCTHYRHIPTTKALEDLGYRHFFSIDPHHQVFHDDAHRVAGQLIKKIQFGEQKKEKPYISVFPRKRKIQNGKNLDMSEQIQWIKSNYQNKKIFGHGFNNERFNLNIDFVNDVYEQINVFNNSEFFICPSSGLADFSLMCGCNVILTGEYKGLENVNVHNCYIKMWKDLK